jgi:hypothetical protein
VSKPDTPPLLDGGAAEDSWAVSSVENHQTAPARPTTPPQAREMPGAGAASGASAAGAETADVVDSLPVVLAVLHTLGIRVVHGSTDGDDNGAIDDDDDDDSGGAGACRRRRQAAAAHALRRRLTRLVFEHTAECRTQAESIACCASEGVCCFLQD